MAKKTKVDDISTDSSDLTKEELEAKRAEVTAYYEDHIPSLKIQLEYENLLRDIEKTRAERLQAQMFIANTMAGPPGENGKSTNQISKEASEAFNKAQEEAKKMRDNAPRTLKRKADATN